MMERVLYAAVLCRGEPIFLPRPNRHHNVLWMLGKRGHSSKQGFVTDAGRFVDRIEGAAIALAAKQIERLNWPPNLFSEDLW